MEEGKGQEIYSVEVIWVHKLEFLTFSQNIGSFDNRIKVMTNLPRNKQTFITLHEVPRGLPKRHVIMVPAKHSDSFQGTCLGKFSPLLNSGIRHSILISHRIVSRAIGPSLSVWAGSLLCLVLWCIMKTGVNKIVTKGAYVDNLSGDTVGRHLQRHWELLKGKDKWDLKPPRTVSGLPRGDDTRLHYHE